MIILFPTLGPPLSNTTAHAKEVATLFLNVFFFFFEVDIDSEETAKLVQRGPNITTVLNLW